MNTSAITTVTCCAAENLSGAACASWHTQRELIEYRSREQYESRFVYLCGTHRKAACGRRGIGLRRHGGTWRLVADRHKKQRMGTPV